MSTFANPPCDAGQIASCRPPTIPPLHGGWILAATILGSSMAFIDSTVVNVALPAVQRALGATSSQVQWVVEAYSLFLAALILLGGVLGDHWGRRRIFIAGIVLFTVASMLCGLAPTTTVLIVARAVQGIGGALLTPSSLAIIGASFDSEKRGAAIGTWSGFTAITSALGPVLGGTLVQQVSWRAVFFINLPVAIAVLAVVWRHVPESWGDRTHGVDWSGAALITLALGAITYGLLGWTSNPVAPTAITLVAGGAAFVAFLIVESREQAPLVPLHLFRSPEFSGANLLTLLLYAALGGALYFLPFELIQVDGYSPSAAGLALLPFILIMFLLSRWSGGLVARYGARRPLVIGPLIAAAGFALFARAGTGGGYWTTFFPAAIVLGLGMATAVAPLTTTVMSSVGEEHSGLASGVNNAVARTAGLLAIAIMGIIVLATFRSVLATRLTTAPLTSDVRQQIQSQNDRLAGIEIPATVSDTDRDAIRAAVDAAFVKGFRAALVLAAALALASALSAEILIGGQTRAVAGQSRRGAAEA